MTQPLESLLRASTLDYGHIQLFHDESGWVADISRYRRDPREAGTGEVFGDPVDALRAVLIEDDRIERDLARKYAAAARVPAGDDDDFEGLL